jgi:hypothetical protein
MFGRHAYVYERALAVMRDLSYGQISVLMERCRNESERYALHAVLRGGPAERASEQWLLRNLCGSDRGELRAFLAYWQRKIPGTLVRLDPVAGEFTYPESCRGMDDVSYRRKVEGNGYWVGEPLRSARRALPGFADVVFR